MRWQMGRRSDNIEDRRGIGAGGVAVGGGLGTIVLLLVALYLGVDPSVLLQGGGPGVSTAPSGVDRPATSPQQDKLKDFVAVVLGDTEDTWRALFSRMGREYHEPRLVLFSDVVRSSCGTAQSASAPSTAPWIRRSTST